MIPLILVLALWAILFGAMAVLASFPLDTERRMATPSNVIDAIRAECNPSTKAADSDPLIPLVPRKIWNASCLGMDSEAIRSATAKLLTIPMFEKVLSRPEAMP